jgi:hypothetical protein
MRDRDDSRRQGYGPRSDESGEPDQWRYREDQDEWRHGSRWMHGSDRGFDRGGGGWRPEGRGGGRWQRDESGYGPRGEGYQGGYNMGMNYGQGGPQGQGFGPGQPGGYRGQGYGGGDQDDRGDWGGGDYGYGGGPGPRGHSGASYGGFGGHGYARGEGSWRQGRWQPGPGQEHPYGQSYRQSSGHHHEDDRGQSLQRGFGMSPYGGYPAREEGAYGGDEERGTWGGSGYQGSGFGGSPGGRQARAPRGYQRSDERIREDICDTVIRMGIDAGDVDINVERCEVTLTGTVDNRYDKRRLEDLAESVSGVKHVHNQLRVEEQQRGQSKSTSGETQNQPGGYGGTSANGGKNATEHDSRTHH